MDKKNLLPGQDWDFYINQELRRADFIVILLSDVSVSKRGYVQKEFKKAVTYFEERLESDIYIIPIKINDCNTPEKLSKFQWIEYSSETSFPSILASINAQQEILKSSQSNLIASQLGFKFSSYSKVGEYGFENPKQIFEIEYLKFDDNTIESLAEINLFIENIVLQMLFWARENYNYVKKWREDMEFKKHEGFLMDSSIYAKIKWERLSSTFISFSNFQSMYSSGAAHGNFGTKGYNFFLNPLREFNLLECLENSTKSLLILRDIVHKKLMDHAQKDLSVDINHFYNNQESELKPVPENFNNYYLLENSIVFIYNPYHITAYVLGAHHIEISFDELLLAFPNEKKLCECIAFLQSDNPLNLL